MIESCSGVYLTKINSSREVFRLTSAEEIED